ncbi:hypothetical protein LJC22_03990 [Desulfosarcina sp. OttesenSCG-928-G10]|nr:hypothetical protein [Desulfosarcina sp. OttesenSCG-928-G10]
MIPDRYTLTATPDTLTQYASTSVTLTLKKNNVALGNAEVAFEANTRFRELSAETSRTTDNNGQMVLTLTATSSGSQTIQATIDGQTMSVTFTVEAVVSPDRYALVADPASLFQNEAENVTFTVRRNGLPLANTPVAFKSNPYFTELASDVNQTTNDSGQISLSLTGTALGSQTIQASVDGRTVSVKITVAAAVYELEASPASLTQHLPANVTFTVKRNNAALASTPVTFAVNTNFTELASEVTQTTDGAGQIKLNLTGTASGNQAISATVDGKAVSVKITVAAATYDLRQTLPAATLYVGSATAAVFVLTQNGHLVGDGTQVSLTYSGSGAFFDPPGSATVAAGGTFSLNLTGETAGDVTITATWDSGTKSAQCTVTVNPETYSLVFGSVSGNTGPFTTSQTATIPVTLQRNGGAYTQATNVTWSVVSADNSANKAVTSGNKMKATGLAWGNSPKTQTSNTDTTIDGTNTSATNTSTGEASIDLTDIMGERTITVQASVTINGKSVTNTQTVTFGKGPLSKFEIKSPGSSGVGYGNWDTAYEACNDTAYTGNYIDGWTIGADVGDGKMPTRDELIAVSGGSVRRPAAYLAAGWPGREFWTGEPYSDGYIFFINVDSGRFLSYSGVSQKHSFVCRRQP